MRLATTLALLLAVAPIASASLAPEPDAGAAQAGAPFVTCHGENDAKLPATVSLRAMRCLVNRVRSRHGASDLQASPLLDRSSTLKAGAIERCGELSHTACGQSVLSVFEQVHYVRGGNWAVGENLAHLVGGSARDALEGWLASPAHRRILLSPNWRELGVGLRTRAEPSGALGSVWVAHFGRRS